MEDLVLGKDEEEEVVDDEGKEKEEKVTKTVKLVEKEFVALMRMWRIMRRRKRR